MMKPRKIVLISSTPLTITVTRNRLMPFISLLKAKKINVELVCPKSNYDQSNYTDSFEIIEVDIKTYKPNNFIKRAFKEIEDAKELLKIANNRSADGYLISIPSMFLCFLAPIYLKRKKVFLDIRDLQWEYLAEKSILQKSAKQLFKLYFKKSLNFFEIVSVTNNAELSYVNRHWKGDTGPILVTNGIMQDQFDRLKDITLSDKQKLTITYIGNIGIAQNLKTLVLAAKELPDVDFVIVGSGIELSSIEKLIVNKGVKNVKLIGRVSWDEVKFYYDQTHILYAQLTPEFSGAMPSKLYEYLATGKSIIYGGTGQAIKQLKEFSNVICIPPCDHVLLVEKISVFNQRNKLKPTVSYTNRKLIEHYYIREDAAQPFIDMIYQTIT